MLARQMPHFPAEEGRVGASTSEGSENGPTGCCPPSRTLPQLRQGRLLWKLSRPPSPQAPALRINCSGQRRWNGVATHHRQACRGALGNPLPYPTLSLGTAQERLSSSQLPGSLFCMQRVMESGAKGLASGHPVRSGSKPSLQLLVQVSFQHIVTCLPPAAQL